MNKLREIGQNVKILVKMDKFWSKKGQNFQQIERNWPKCQFLVKNDNFLVKSGPKMGKIDISLNFHWAILVLDQNVVSIREISKIP